MKSPASRGFFIACKLLAYQKRNVYNYSLILFCQNLWHVTCVYNTKLCNT